MILKLQMKSNSEGYKHVRLLTVNVKGYGIGGLNVLGSPYSRHGCCLLNCKKMIK